MFRWIYTAFIIAYLLSIFFCVKKRVWRKEDGQGQFFSKSDTTTLKGILIIMVILHHFRLMFRSPFEGCPAFFVRAYDYSINMIGPLAVCGFFLIAGYVAHLEFDKTNDHFSFFLIKKAYRLYLPILIFTLPINNFLGGLLWMYFVTFTGYRFLHGRKHRLIFVWGGVLVFVAAGAMLHWDIWWYDCIFPFGMGFTLADVLIQNVLTVPRITKRIKCFCLPLTIVAFIAVNLLNCYHFETYLLIMIGCIFSLLLILLLFCFSLRSPVFNFLGEHSWEIFFLHQLNFWWIGNSNLDLGLVFTLGLVATVAEAYLLHKLWFWGWSRLEKRLLSNE